MGGGLRRRTAGERDGEGIVSPSGGRGVEVEVGGGRQFY